MGNTELRHRVAEMVSEATGGAVSVADALTDGSLVALGVDSLGLLRLVDAIELEYGVEIELSGGGQRLDSVDDVVAALVQAHPGDVDGLAVARPEAV